MLEQRLKFFLDDIIRDAFVTCNDQGTKDMACTNEKKGCIGLFVIDSAFNVIY